MGFLNPLVSRSTAASNAVFATQLSKAAGLLSAFDGTMPALTVKYPMPASTTRVKIMPPRKLTIDFIVLDVRPQQVIDSGHTKKGKIPEARTYTNWVSRAFEPVIFSSGSPGRIKTKAR